MNASVSSRRRNTEGMPSLLWKVSFSPNSTLSFDGHSPPRGRSYTSLRELKHVTTGWHAQSRGRSVRSRVRSFRAALVGWCGRTIDVERKRVVQIESEVWEGVVHGGDADWFTELASRDAGLGMQVDWKRSIH
jgi:hypothetical protein